MARINLGQTDKEMYGVEAVPSKSMKNKIRYPHLSVNKKLPVSDKYLGKTLNVGVELKLTGIRETKENGKERYSCDFDVLSINFPKLKDYSSTEGMKEIIKEI